MIFNWDRAYLNPHEAIELINSKRGVIPVDIDLEAKHLIWLDVADHHFSESFFFVSIEKLFNNTQFTFATDLSILDSDTIVADALYPNGFIFHMGRCGSTLLAKILAQSEENLVISEAPPHFLIWSLWNEDWMRPFPFTEEHIHRYKNLVFAIGRKRRPGYNAHFIKFTTFNILYLDFIRHVFPDVPIIFLYRDPVEVMVAFTDQGPGWQRFKDSAFGAFVAGCSLNQVKAMNKQSFHQHFLSQFMEAAIQASSNGLTLVNYHHLIPQNLEFILNAMNFTVNDETLDRMIKQFKYYAKADEQPIIFIPDTLEKRQKITPEIEALALSRLMPLYERLEQAENNFSLQLASKQGQIDQAHGSKR